MRLYDIFLHAVAVVVLLCGTRKFMQDFMFAADDMGMTDPEEYVYLLTLHNVVDVSQPWRSEHRRSYRPNAAHAFRPVLQVR